MLLLALFSKTMLAIVRYSGRASRFEYWNFYCFSWIIGGSSAIVRDMANLGDTSWFDTVIGFVFAWSFLAYGSLMVRRCHDLGMSGLVMLAPVFGASLAFAGFVAMNAPEAGIDPQLARLLLLAGAGALIGASVLSFALSVWPGQDRDNRFGDAPYE